MCSIFGFVANKNARPDLNTLRSIVRANIRRGPHAFGLSWIDSNGRLHMFKSAGSLTDSLSVLSLVRDARLLIGHLRYATHGSPDTNCNNHPHPSDGGWIVHNGVVTNYNDLVKDHNLPILTECDSESLALLIEHSPGTLLSRATATTAESTGNLALLGLWKGRDPKSIGQLLIVRRGNPLHSSDTVDGTYLATLSNGLPGKPSPLRDDTASLITLASTFSRTLTAKTIPTHATAASLFSSTSPAGEYQGG